MIDCPSLAKFSTRKIKSRPIGQDTFYTTHHIMLPELWAERMMKEGRTHVVIRELDNGQLAIIPVTHQQARDMARTRRAI
jgi:hypothetical protein